SMVDNGFRKVLQKLPVPGSEKNADGTLDAVLENFGTESMDRLARLFSGEGVRAQPSVQAAIDALFVKLTENKIANVNYVDRVLNKVGDTIDNINDWGVDTIQNVSAALYDKLDSAELAARNRLSKSVLGVTKALV